MIISRSLDAAQGAEGRLHFYDVTLPLQEHVSILGVEVDREMRFGHHLNNIAHQAPLRVSVLRRVARYIDATGVFVHFEVQIRHYLEYAALTWMSSAPSHLHRLETVEQRPMRLVQGRERKLPPPLDPEKHRRDMASLVVFQNG